MGHGHVASKQPTAPSLPSSSALPGDRKSFTPCVPFQVLLGATRHHCSHSWDASGWLGPEGCTATSCPSCAMGCCCPLCSPQPQARPVPSLNPPALSPILLGSHSPIAASLN